MAGLGIFNVCRTIPNCTRPRGLRLYAVYLGWVLSKYSPRARPASLGRHSPSSKPPYKEAKDRIRRANLDGTRDETFVSGLSDPPGVKLGIR